MGKELPSAFASGPTSPTKSLVSRGILPSPGAAPPPLTPVTDSLPSQSRTGQPAGEGWGPELWLLRTEVNMMIKKLKRYCTRALHRLQKGPGYTYKELWVWYCENTNTHGPKRIVSEGPKKKVMWFILTLVFTGLVFWQWGLLIQSYLSYEISVSLSVGFRTNQFPAVTVCNANPFKYSKVKHLLQELDDLVSTALKRIQLSNQPSMAGAALSSNTTGNGSYTLDPRLWNNIPLLIIDETDPDNPVIVNIFENTPNSNITNSISSRSPNPRAYSQRIKVAMQMCTNNGTECSYRNFSSAVQAVSEWYVLQFNNILSAIPEAEKIEMGYTAKDMILTCLFGVQPCSYRNFTQLYHPIYGNCYVFNWGQDEEVLVSTNPGVEFGLKLVLDINQGEYIPYLQSTASSVIMLHEQRSYPYLKDLGFFAQTGAETSIGILLDEIQHLGDPYSSCTVDGSDIPWTNLYWQYNSSYSIQSCLRSCFQSQMVQMCGCSSYLYPELKKSQYCNDVKNPDWVPCYFKVLDSVDFRDICIQSCKQPCNNTQYRMTISMADWPSESSEDWIYHVLSSERDSSTNITVKRNGVMKVNIYFQEFNYRTVSESAATNIVLLLSNLEGQFGFWMGGSILCIIEFLEIIVDCFWITIIKIIAWSKQREHKRAAARYDMAPPTVSELVDGQTNPGFYKEEIKKDPPPIPGTPPPNYDSLRVHPIDVLELSEEEDN
uniref:Amiloride-sensitive sodium channel subunit beta n=1 Tax=Geotrypetes seraphini TaxID=260995 RepID=A0A6P8SIK6_GEOSA|nr:amiloride-sensitive sodium channel subunit beta [Geotrypetes seraphini]